MIFKNNQNKKSDTKASLRGAYFTETENGELTENSAKRYFSFLGFVTILVFALQGIVQIIATLVINKLAPSLADNIYVSFAIAYIPLYFIAMPIGALLLGRLPRARQLKAKTSVKHWLGGMCVAFSLMLMGSYISQFVSLLVETLKGSALRNPVSEAVQSTPLIITLIFNVIVAPIAEELFFRKLLCDRLSPLGDGYAIFVPGHNKS